MTQPKVMVRIFFKTAEGPKPSGSYTFDQTEFERLKQDFIDEQRAGTYQCSYAQGNGWIPTQLLLKFNEVAYIGG